MKSIGIIFDGDDTLWETMPVYTAAKEEFFKEMSLIGFEPQEVEKAFESRDVANVRKLGFTKHRFPTSMAETYQFFCGKYNFAAEEVVEQRMKGIGYSVFAKPPLVFPYAEQVLSKLHFRYKLILATKGEKEIQQSKVEHSGLSKYFSKIYFLDQKTEHELRQISQDCELDIPNSWIIGNSLKSDINPGLRIGLKAIWIPYYTWEYEEDEHPTSDSLYKVHSLSDCLDILFPE
jgi:putative hydrolase of the HAD superfamily